MLKYTGHPLVDVGIATIVAFAKKNRPEELTVEDLEAIANFMAQNYTVNPMRSFLTVAFPNSGFTQPAYFKEPEKQQIYADRVLRAFKPDVPQLEDLDVFTGLPAAAVPFDVKGLLSPGKAFRQHIPLITREDVINFSSYGEAGLSVSGPTLLAIQALPLGSAKCNGRMLAVHSDNPEIILHYARKFLEQNRVAIQWAQQNDSSKMPETRLKHRTLLISTLLDARIMQQDTAIQQEEPFSITAYHLSNSGQGVDLDIYHLPSQLILYLQEMESQEYSALWRRLVGSAWERPKLKKGQTPEDFTPSRNWLYEDLFQLANDVYLTAPRFVRAHFVANSLAYAKNKTNDTGGYSHFISWKLVEPFLRRILSMDPLRIQNIRDLGDALADYVRSQNDKRFFRNFYTEGRYDYFRNLLIKANTDSVRRGQPPFLTFDRYISIFEEGEELAYHDWRLARDLVFIRMVEQLRSWLDTHQDALPEIVSETEEAA